MKKKDKKKKINVKNFVLSKGFYITLATLIIVFGTAAVVRKLTDDVIIDSSSFNETAWTDAIESVNKDSEADRDKEIIEEVIYEPDVTDITVPVLTEPTVSVNKEQTLDEIISGLDIRLPFEGEILQIHSPDKHVFYKKMNDWRTHSGIDISAQEGDIVKASAHGVVEKVYEDKKLGIVVEIGHDGNIVTRYANLADINFIEVGRKVAQGDTIGSVGQSSPIEDHNKPHIHFEILINGESKNPPEFISL